MDAKAWLEIRDSVLYSLRDLGFFLSKAVLVISGVISFLIAILLFLYPYWEGQGWWLLLGCPIWIVFAILGESIGNSSFKQEETSDILTLFALIAIAVAMIIPFLIFGLNFNPIWSWWVLPILIIAFWALILVSEWIYVLVTAGIISLLVKFGWKKISAVSVGICLLAAILLVIQSKSVKKDIAVIVSAEEDADFSFSSLSDSSDFEKSPDSVFPDTIRVTGDWKRLELPSRHKCKFIVAEGDTLEILGKDGQSVRVIGGQPEVKLPKMTKPPYFVWLRSRRPINVVFSAQSVN